MPANQIVRDFSVSELLDLAEKGPWPACRADERDSLTNSRDFAGVTLSEACRLLEAGWPEGRARMREAIDRLPAPYGVGEVRGLDVAGWYPDVARAVAGDPLNMVSVSKRKTHRYADIYISAAYVCKTTKETIFDRGATIVRAIDDLEHSGVRCRLVACFTGGSMKRQGPYTKGSDADLISHRVTVKNHRDPFDIDKLAFILANPAMFRRIIFSTYETEPLDVARMFGFGSHGGYTYQGSDVQDFLIPDGAIYIPQNIEPGLIHGRIVEALSR